MDNCTSIETNPGGYLRFHPANTGDIIANIASLAHTLITNLKVNQVVIKVINPGAYAAENRIPVLAQGQAGCF